MKLYQRCLAGIIIITTIFSQELNISTLEELIMGGNLSLKISEKEIEIKSELHRQSKTYPNPKIGIESNLESNSEISGMLTQTIITGGKRKHNIQLHALELNLSKLENENKKLTILNEAISIFAEILLLQESELLQQDRIKISEQLLEAVNKKVTAGKLSPAESSRAKIHLLGRYEKTDPLPQSISDPVLDKPGLLDKVKKAASKYEGENVGSFK